ncbi:uncharacterized protein BX663DRAFT_500904 [Cokeromyces recurvatus]|uniref:uncharacterized protein n=1 Tax=Cokeromyces recurvatus TaxID=90255 RepID=UPI00221F40D8|nr:uncharacterized protein BX663DRAFT_500904 [Cokeromyces recurvatus]KAI7905785.1 hypothetical protein BX663DRAFT_500904 [Cokeromyces recurvatus]
MALKPPLVEEFIQHAVIEVSSVNDGKQSIEQQIEVYVNDLFNVQDNKHISIEEILEGLRYVMDFRIKNGSQPHLEKSLMKRLSEGLFLNMTHTEGHLLRKKATEAADMAFFLFIDFLEEVEEFRTVVNEMDVSDLRHQLKLHYRCQPNSSTTIQKRGALAVVFKLAHYFPNQFGDWRDLIKESEQSDLERLLNSSLASEVKASEEKARVAATTTTTSQISPHHHHQSILLPPQALYFDRPLDKLIGMFSYTHTENGLPEDLVPSLREHYGTNQLPKPPRPNPFKMLWLQLTDFMVLILIIAAIVEAAEREFNSMIVLLVVVVLNTIIGFSQEWKASKTLNALMNLSVPQARVIRGSEQKLINSEELVPGDLVILEEGDAVPADIRLIDVAQLSVVEGVLTGESLPVQKNIEAIKAKTRKIPLGDCKGNAFMATTVARGRAKGIVVRTGLKTEIGKISAAIQSGTKHKVKTPIQKKLGKLGIYLVALAIFLCALVVVIGVIWKRNAKEMVNIGLSLAVSVIPEGLVAVTTVTMAIGVRRMAANKCIVRTLPAVESLGGVTVICSDKTGTLTEGKMSTTELWTSDNSLYRFMGTNSMDVKQGEIIREHEELRRRMIHHRSTVPNKFSSPPLAYSSTKPNLEDHSSSINDYATMKPKPIDRDHIESYTQHLYYALMIASLCNNSDVRHNEETGEFETVGDPTEVALTVATQKARLDRKYWESQGFVKYFEHAFDSERKLMSCVFKQQNEEAIITMVCKGAPEELLNKCSHFLMKDDTLSEMTEEFASLVYDENVRMASQGLRVLGLAYKKIIKTDDNEDHFSESELVFVGLVGLIDPPKVGVKEAIETCQQAGIHVMMITGDHIETATAIAAQLGIFKRDHPKMNRAILGRELDLLSDDAIMELDPFPSVFARVSPDNKLSIVRSLQQRGELVAMTGDGVNDAPAIKRADVGVAMGQAGTEITKQAADIVLADDNFTSIVHAVEEGRHVFDNILKFIVYLLSCNGAEIFLMLICTIANIESPLTVMMILWANIIADIPPAMALGVEPNEKDLMNRKPRNPKTEVITKATWLIIFTNSMLIASLAIATYTISLYILKFDLEIARSMTFTTLTTLQLIHSFNARSVHQSIFKTGITSNCWMIGSFILAFSLMILGIYAPGISSWLELTSVGWQSWVMTIICVIFLISFVEIEKFVIRRMINKI